MHKRTALFTRLTLLAAIVVALSGVTGGAAAADQPPLCPDPAKPLTAGPVVVRGWVINHREAPVNGTRTPTPLVMTALASDGALVAAPVANNGYFQLTLTPGVWDFVMELPEGWDGIVPIAARGALARTGCTPLPGRSQPYLIVFKIRRVFDVPVLKWEETPSGAVQRGPGWQINFQPVGDPFAVSQTATTDASGTAWAGLTPGVWTICETARSGWTPVTPPSVSITLDEYAPQGPLNPVVFKNRQTY